MEQATPAAILLDLGLPDRDGLSLVPLLRRMSDAMILIVSARHEIHQKVAALDLGADDYITKPLISEELLARLRVALRHKSEPKKPTSFRVGTLEIDLTDRTVGRRGEEVHLTRKEYEVLPCLASSPRQVITHQRILEAAWPQENDRKIEYLWIVIRSLRHKVEAAEAVGSVVANELGIRLPFGR